MKTKLVPATTNNITKAVINFLNSKGHFAFRVNTTGIYDRDRGRYRIMDKNSLGCPDIIACLSTRMIALNGLGVFIGFEVKNKNTKDKISKHQKIFHDKVIAAKGAIVIIESYEQFLEWYNHSVFQ